MGPDIHAASLGVILCNNRLIPSSYSIHQNHRVPLFQAEDFDSVFGFRFIQYMGLAIEERGIEQVHGMDLELKIVNYRSIVYGMIRIGLLSDTHGFLDTRIREYFAGCNEIWHAGDVGDLEVIRLLSRIAPVIAVHGNIDGTSIRSRYPAHQRLEREGLDVWMTHIGGYPGNYDSRVKPEIFTNPPGLFISGHSHILKVMPDKKLGFLHMNPGAAGRSGLHKVRTLIRFEVDQGKMDQVDVIELGPRSSGRFAAIHDS
jgi:putative phosphoesterase